MTHLPESPLLQQWLINFNVPPAPPTSQINRHQVRVQGGAAEQARVREINAMFGGSEERFHGKEEAYDSVCDSFDYYLQTLAQVERDPSIDRTEVTKQTVSHCRQQLTSVFPYCGEAYRVIAIIFSKEGLHDLAIGCCGASLKCYEATDPELVNETTEIAWGYVEHRPYLRTLMSMAQCFEAGGRDEDAKRMYRDLLEKNPNDNTGCRYMLFYACLRTNDLDKAEAISRDNARDGEESTPFVWGDLILKYLRFQRGHIDQATFNAKLSKAVAKNLYIADLLLSDNPLPPPPPHIAPESMNEAVSVCHGIKSTWESVEGIADYVAGEMYRDGRKPSTSKDVFDILTKGNVLVRTHGELDSIMTTDVSIMFGRGVESFNVPTGTKEHVEGAPLVMFENAPSSARWHKIRFEDIAEVPFWRLRMEAKKKKYVNGGTCSKCYESFEKLMTCGGCGVEKYCSKACQKAAWIGTGFSCHRAMCKRWVKK